MRPNPRLSLLDRLTGIEPGFDPYSTLRRQVLQDIQRLLNTRRPEQPIRTPSLTEANSSILTYGLPDFSAMTVLSETDHYAIRDAIKLALKNFEPRLDRVRVTLVHTERNDPVLRFRIEAVLNVDQSLREDIVFDARLDPATRRFVEDRP